MKCKKYTSVFMLVNKPILTYSGSYSNNIIHLPLNQSNTKIIEVGIKL